MRRHRTRALLAVLSAALFIAPVFALTAPAAPGDPAAPAAPIAEEKKVVVLRVNFSDYPATSTYTRSEIDGFMDAISSLFFNTSNGHLRVVPEVSDLFSVPGEYADYVNTATDNSFTSAGLLQLLQDAVANAPASVDFTDAAQVTVLFSETGSKFNRGRYSPGGCDLAIGPGGATARVGCAGFSENPTHNERHMWGRMMHEIGHAFQNDAWAGHPHGYDSDFELMDAAYPGHVSAWSLQEDRAFPGWMPTSKTERVGVSEEGGYTCLWALEYNAYGRPNKQVLRMDLSEQVYYLLSVRRSVNGDELNGLLQDWEGFTFPGIPDEGVLIERVDEAASKTVTIVPPPGADRRSLWQKGDAFDSAADDVHVRIESNFDDDFFCMQYWFGSKAGLPDLMMHPWTSPPGNTWETTDIWIDSPLNGYGAPTAAGWADDGTIRYGTWDDGDGYLVPRGNGDNPAIAQDNRLYARVHNKGTAPATDVEVTFQHSNPPGVGIRADTAWATIGTVDQSDFPALASIPAGGAVEVLVEWAPTYDPPSDEDVEDGSFYFHTCVRVLLASSNTDLTLMNQDGINEQENIAYFDVESGGGGTGGIAIEHSLRLHNPDVVGERDFTFHVDTDAPADWDIKVNGGSPFVTVPAGGMQVVDVTIVPGQGAKPGENYRFDVSVTYDRYLVSDLNQKSRHLEVTRMGGVSFAAGVGWAADITCDAQLLVGGAIEVTGNLFTEPLANGDEFDLPVFVQGITRDGRWLKDSVALTYATDEDGAFQVILEQRSLGDVDAVACLFGGTDDIVSTGFVTSGVRVVGPVFMPPLPTLPGSDPCALAACDYVPRVCLTVTGCVTLTDPDSVSRGVGRAVRDAVPPVECTVTCGVDTGDIVRLVDDAPVPCVTGCDSIGRLPSVNEVTETAKREVAEAGDGDLCNEQVCVRYGTLLERYQEITLRQVCDRLKIGC